MQEETTHITICPQGPMKVEGNCELKDAEGCLLETSGTEICLCRCGHSKKKPFCDETHKKVIWNDLLR